VPFFCGSTNDTFASIRDFPTAIIKPNDEILLLDKQIDGNSKIIDLVKSSLEKERG
jgi:hypothetical protein